MVLITVIFSFLRPRNTVVYAPKLKYADAEHAPPQIGNGLFAWFMPLTKTKEAQLVDKVGMDGTVFLRFTRMCRNIFLVLSVISVAILIPANTVGSNKDGIKGDPNKIFLAMTPQWMKQDALWTHVVSAYLINLVVAFFLWRNYIAVARLRRQYFLSTDYLASLHSRTVMITDIPKSIRTDEGILRLLDDFGKSAAFPRAAIGRNVKELPDLIEEHETMVRKLESVLAKYLKNPDRLPSTRPTITPSRKYRKNNGVTKVDAIDYLTSRIRELEGEIMYVRESVDKRNPMPYGFASYEKIEDAHTVAFETRKKHPHGTTVRMAPRPTDLIWKNLPLSKNARRWKRFMINIWISLLTVVWIVPNALIAIFLSNLNNLALVWPAFRENFRRYPATWSAVQGIASPALMSLVYLILPIIFRRLLIRAGDSTKTSRERHVTTKLYAFFVFNNLIIFSIFSTLWAFIAAVINRQRDQSVWDAIRNGEFTSKMMYGLSAVSPFWLTWLLQRNLGAAVDLAQVISLGWIWIYRTFMSPTPRQTIEWTAPPPFDYAVYFNYFLFYATVALSFVTLQPLVLPITALYFAVDYLLKKYLLLYIFITKNESGGLYWRSVFNRMIFAILLSDFVIALIVRGNGGTWTKIGSMAPLPILTGIFKWYCAMRFDDESHYSIKGTLKDPETPTGAAPKSRGKDRVVSRFGHPALYKPLMTPMVHAKAQHVLPQVYRGRLEDVDHDGDGATPANYSDIAMDSMSRSHPGKTTRFAPGAEAKKLFEIVPESQLDFAYYKDRSEFGEEHGEGVIYGRPADLIRDRSGTPQSFLGSSNGSITSSRGSSPAPAVGAATGPRLPRRTGSPSGDESDVGDAGYRDPAARGRRMYQGRNESENRLLSGAQPIGLAPGVEGRSREPYGSERGSGEHEFFRGESPDGGTRYDYFRGNR
jgi:hypothetical protein